MARALEEHWQGPLSGLVVTRYGHNQSHLVEVGATVKKGQQIALMGSSGRSTGPHVHFEVLLDGKTVNPAKYTGE